MSITLSLAEARRLAVASQGFGTRPAKPSIDHVRKLAATIHAFQIDSVNVLARAHYVPAFARLGPYRMSTIDTLAYTKRELFEYWGHAACLLPVSLYALFRYRMHADETREYMRTPAGANLAKVYDEVAERGPLTVGELSEPGKRSSKWWGWGDGKLRLEALFDAGFVAIAGRRGFERVYDLAERVIPRAALDAPVPTRDESMKQLICLGAAAHGVGTLNDIASYFYTGGWYDRRARWPWWTAQTGKSPVKRLALELVDEGRLIPATVEGWSETAYVVPGARVPSSIDARALVTPFDSLVWERDRVDRLFGMKYTIEIYLPPPKRVYGYYVFPFLLGDTLVARCDLKADRARGVLMVRTAHLEAKQKATRVAKGLAEELRLMQTWLELDHIEVDDRGDLASALRRATKPTNAGATNGRAKNAADQKKRRTVSRRDRGRDATA
jgi:uncharacterized protein YcaQ